MTVLDESTTVVAESKHKAAVIDDAFDDADIKDVPFDNYRKFLQKTTTFNTILEEVGIMPPTIAELEEDEDLYIQLLDRIWKEREHEKLAPHIQDEYLFQTKWNNLQELQTLCKNLEDHGLEIEKFPSEIPSPDIFIEGNFTYIFIDYNLGIGGGSSAQKNARKVAADIYGKYPAGSKPMTVLMSNAPNIASKKEEFKDKAGLLEGVFRVSQKEDLTNEFKVSLIAKAYQEAFRSNDSLQQYISSLEKASAEAQKNFIDQIRSLSIDDYEFIQDNKLKGQQQPLGDYLAWLYGSLWSDLLLKNKNLKPTTAQLDKIVSSKAPLHDAMPSKKLAEIFTIALFEDDMSEIQDHHAAEEASNKEKFKHFHLGDIFTKVKTTTVYMILNPQCDLERPSQKSESNSIFLIPGELEAFDSAIDERRIEYPRTDLFKFDGDRYRIVWMFKKVFAIPQMEVGIWLKEQGLQRKFRLRLPYALEIQQRFTSQLSRVGLPIAPPLTNQVKIAVKLKKWDEKGVFKEIVSGDEFIFMTVNPTKKNAIKFTLQFGVAFKGNLVEELNALKTAAAVYEAAPKALTKHIKSIEEFLGKFDDWFLKLKEFTIPDVGVFEWIKNHSNVLLQSFEATTTPTQDPLIWFDISSLESDESAEETVEKGAKE